MVLCVVKVLSVCPICFVGLIARLKGPFVFSQFR